MPGSENNFPKETSQPQKLHASIPGKAQIKIVWSNPDWKSQQLSFEAYSNKHFPFESPAPVPEVGRECGWRDIISCLLIITPPVSETDSGEGTSNNKTEGWLADFIKVNIERDVNFFFEG